jgi:hypothetical protein
MKILHGKKFVSAVYVLKRLRNKCIFSRQRALSPNTLSKLQMGKVQQNLLLGSDGSNTLHSYE